jgi:hypothetical protein
MGNAWSGAKGLKKAVFGQRLDLQSEEESAAAGLASVATARRL